MGHELRELKQEVQDLLEEKEVRDKEHAEELDELRLEHSQEVYMLKRLKN